LHIHLCIVTDQRISVIMQRRELPVIIGYITVLTNHVWIEYIDVWRCWQNGNTYWSNDGLSGAFNLENMLEDYFAISNHREY